MSQERIFAPQVAASIAVGSSVKSQVSPVEDTANAASATATAAKTTANTANGTVTTFGHHTAFGIVSGVVQQIPINTLNNTTTTPTLDNLNDGTTYNRVLATALTSNAIDTTKAGFLAEGGSIIPQIVGTTASLFSYTSTTTTVDITWPTFTVSYPDGTSASVTGNSKSITGLTSNTTYYFYAYLASGSTTVSFVSVFGGQGTPAILYATTQSPLAAQNMNLQSRTALSNGGLVTTTPVSGSGGGSSGGGSGLCVRSTMMVQCKDLGEVRIADCKVGDFILSRNGWTEITQMQILPQETFVRLETDYDNLEITATHCITTAEEESKPAAKLTLSDFLIRRYGYTALNAIKVVHVENGIKVKLTCEPEHTFYAGERHAQLLAHNSVPIS